MCMLLRKEPVEVNLDSGDKFYYVSVLKSLEKLLNDEGVFAEVNGFIVTCVLTVHVILLMLKKCY